MQGNKVTVPAIIVVMILVAMTASLPRLSATVRAEGISAPPWSRQGMQAWGAQNIAVDFGARGLWSYNGAWIQLSRLDPQHMASWGGGNLAIDFGDHGLWTYDGHSWLKISL